MSEEQTSNLEFEEDKTQNFKDVCDNLPNRYDKKRVKSFYSKYANDPDEGYANLYKLAYLSGKGGETHTKLCSEFLAGFTHLKVPADTSHPQFKQYVKHLIKEYTRAGKYDSSKAKKEINLLVKNFMPKGDGIVFKLDIDRDSNPVSDISKEAIARLPRIPRERWKSENTYPSVEKLDPWQFLKFVFNDKMRSYSAKKNAAQDKQGYIGVCEDVMTTHMINPQEKSTQDLSECSYVCSGIFTSKNARRTKANLAPNKRPVLVIESDFENVVMQEKTNTFAVILATYAPLIAVVNAGNKSLHYWFNTDDLDKKDFDIVASLAVVYGFDKSTMRQNQPVRMPNVKAKVDKDGIVLRGDQELWFFDPIQCNPDTCKEWRINQFEQVIKEYILIDIYHLPPNKYYRQSVSGRWIETVKSSLESHLALSGIRNFVEEGDAVSPVKEEINKIETTNNLNMVMPQAAGYKAGYHKLPTGQRFLVEDDIPYPPIDRKSGHPKKCKGITNFLKGLLPEGDDYEVFMGWTSGIVKMLYNNNEQRAEMGKPAQFMHLVGPSSTGKSLMVEHVLGKVMGSIASPKKLFQGSQFTKSVAQSPLLVLDDVNGFLSTHAGREEQGEIMKQIIVSSNSDVEGKGVDSFPLPLAQYLLRGLNYSKLSTIPLMSDEDTAEKVIILHATNGGHKIDTDEACKIIAMIESEIKSFYNYLIFQHKIPDHLVGTRYPTISYVNPDVLDQLEEDSDARVLITLLKAAEIPANHFDGERWVWRGTRVEMQQTLQKNLDMSDIGTYKASLGNKSKFMSALQEAYKRDTIDIHYSKQPHIKPEKVDGQLYYVTGYVSVKQDEFEEEPTLE